MGLRIGALLMAQAPERTVMLEKARLVNALFRDGNERHINVKFCRGKSDDLTAEDICREANKALLQIKSGLVHAHSNVEEDTAAIDVRDLDKAL